MKDAVKSARLFAAVAGCLLASACAQAPQNIALSPPPPPTQEREDFRNEDFSWSIVEGATSIEGFVATQVAGKSLSCAGNSVVLTPDAPYSRARMRKLYGSDLMSQKLVSAVRARTTPAPEDYNRYIRATTCDAAGRFLFKGLPAGSWYVITTAQSAHGDLALMLHVETKTGASRAEL